YIPASTEKTVYSIDITWGDMQFQYREGSNGTWNPETLKYDNKTSAGWYLKTVATSNSIGSNQVLISNRSNAEIYCSASFILDPNYTETFGDISGSFDTNSFKLLSAAEEKAAQEKTLSLSLSGLPTILDFTSPTPLGTITLTFESNS
ncbi:MAG: hypothetical protein IIU74_06625, partial [Ruminiclostridium sp.]|nr:hypothetical protein [Ruminiclostridium sp.]